jgi:quercetin dioxygenase-like cupin family protein
MLRVLKGGKGMSPLHEPADLAPRDLETIFQPGASVPVRTMDNDMVCQCTAGSLEITNDGRTFTANTGQAWTCHRGGTEGAVNKGQSPAIMRIIDLLPA